MKIMLMISMLSLLAASTPGGCEGQADRSESDPMDKTEAQWKAELTPEQYHILRGGGTEPPHDNAYFDEKRPGTYVCAGCGLPLFHSDAKFHSGTGWPSFYQPIEPDHVATEADRSHGMTRNEVVCSRCGGHLGHVFEDAPSQPTGLRYCINSAALELKPAEDQ